MAAVPEPAVPMTQRQGGSTGQTRERERKSQPRRYQCCRLPKAQRHSVRSVEIILADVGNHLGRPCKGLGRE